MICATDLPHRAAPFLRLRGSFVFETRDTACTDKYLKYVPTEGVCWTKSRSLSSLQNVVDARRPRRPIPSLSRETIGSQSLASSLLPYIHLVVRARLYHAGRVPSGTVHVCLSSLPPSVYNAEQSMRLPHSMDLSSNLLLNDTENGPHSPRPLPPSQCQSFVLMQVGRYMADEVAHGEV